ncbi:MAG: hypothetical protein ACKVQJ_09470 [Pyrinomonadaceae bacterium]
MRIQEMKSGFSHLKKKTGDERHENHFEQIIGRDESIEPTAIVAPAAEPPCELDEPRWAVVSFDRIEASGLNYAEAAELMSEFDARGIAGLCIVTDEAAERLRT